MVVDLFQATWWPSITGVCCTAAGATSAGRTCCDTWRAPTWTGTKSCLASGYSAARSRTKHEPWKWPHFNRLLYSLVLLGGWELWVKLNVALEKRSVVRTKCKDTEISHNFLRAKSPTLKQQSMNITWTMQRLRKTPWVSDSKVSFGLVMFDECQMSFSVLTLKRFSTFSWVLHIIMMLCNLYMLSKLIYLLISFQKTPRLFLEPLPIQSLLHFIYWPPFSIHWVENESDFRLSPGVNCVIILTSQFLRA